MIEAFSMLSKKKIKNTRPYQDHFIFFVFHSSQPPLSAQSKHHETGQATNGSLKVFSSVYSSLFGFHDLRVKLVYDKDPSQR